MLAVPTDFPIGESEDPRPIIGATLCLMSYVMQSGNAFYVPKIADNLAILANHPNVDSSFRRICNRLCQHWEAFSVDQPVAPESTQASGAAECMCPNILRVHSVKKIH